MNLFVKSSLVILFLFSCGVKEGREDQGVVSKDTSEKTTVDYAKGFKIQYFEDYKLLTVFNPWQDAENIAYTYCLLNIGAKLPEGLDSNIPIIRIPVERVICLSTTHIALLNFINKTDALIGVSGSKYISTSEVRKRIDEKKILDVGYDQQLNYELILSLKPDFVMGYGVGSEVAAYSSKLKELGINVVLNCEYLEQSPLATAEWVKFMAAFFNMEKYASEKFSEVEASYKNTVSLVQHVSEKPKVLTGIPWSSVWYVPGGKSYTAKLIKDAGGDYLWASDNSVVNIPLSVEAVFDKAYKADVWINIFTANCKNDITETDNRLRELKPFKTGNLFNNTLGVNKNGGNDYFESGIVNPHLILKDLVYIFHPYVLSEHKFVYYKKL